MRGTTVKNTRVLAAASAAAEVSSCSARANANTAIILDANGLASIFVLSITLIIRGLLALLPTHFRLEDSPIPA